MAATMAISEGGVEASAGFEGVSHQHVSPGIGLPEELGRGGAATTAGERELRRDRIWEGGWLLNHSIHQKPDQPVHWFSGSDGSRPVQKLPGSNDRTRFSF